MPVSDGQTHANLIIQLQSRDEQHGWGHGSKGRRDMPLTGILVFQDLTLVPAEGKLEAIRGSLLSNQTNVWLHDASQEAVLQRYSGESEDIIQFRYEGSDLPQASLTLWQRDNSYTITNIVPSKQSMLRIAEYNSLVQDFVDNVVKPAKAQNNFLITVTEPVRQLDSWISKGAADALRRFSVLANKSTTNSHPSDAERWEEFVVAIYRENTKLDTDVFVQWLVEIDGWDEISAQKLAIDYEKGLSLLETYDRLSRR